jgi:hypothetical protein
MTATLTREPANATEATEHVASDIAGMLQRVGRLAQLTISDDQFFKETIAELRSGLPLVAAALWLTTPQGLLVPAAETGLGSTGLLRDPQVNRLNSQRLSEAIRNGRAVSHHGLNENTHSGDGPTIHIAPVIGLRGCVGALEVFLPANTDEANTPQEAVSEVAQLISRSLKWREETSSAERQLDFARRLESTALALHARTSTREAAFVAVNDGRQLLQCDRLSLVVRHGSGVRVIAVTGQERVHARSNLVRAMAQIGRLALNAGQPLHYPSSAAAQPRAMSEAFLRFIDQSTARAVCLIPLTAPQTPAPEKSSARATSAPPFGVLIAEHFTEDWLTPVTSARTAWFGEHVALALHNTRRNDGVFLLPLWRALGDALSRLRGSRFAMALVALLLLGAAAAVLVGHQTAYRVEGAGKLMPVVRRDIFAPWDGEVTEVKVRTGQVVEPGDVLVVLRNDELQSQILTARNRLAERQQAFHALRAESDEAAARSLRPDEVLRLRGRLAQIRIEVEGLTQRVTALEAQLESLTLRAPIAGTVATFQVDQVLQNRPVRRGERLLELMDETSAWRIEASVPESRAGHLMAARNRVREAHLPASFVLATHPDATHEGRLVDVATRTTLSEKDGTSVPVVLELDTARLPDRRIGAEAVVKIDCGQKPLGYVLFGDVIEFVQRRWW